MTLPELQEILIYMLREAYAEGNRDGLRMANRINDYLEIDPELNKLFKLWGQESK